jgi:hypothetical protein
MKNLILFGKKLSYFYKIISKNQLKILLIKKIKLFLVEDMVVPNILKCMGQCPLENVQLEN